MSDRAVELYAALLAVSAVADILAAVAAAVAHNAGRPARLPAPAALAAWLPECPEADRLEAARRMDRVARALLDADPRAAEMMLHPTDRLAPFFATPAGEARGYATFARRWLLTDPAEGDWFMPSDHPDYTDWDGTGDPPTVTVPPAIERLHALWLLARQYDPELPHPLAPLVDAWQRLAPVPAMAVTNYDRDLILSRQFATVRDDAEGYYLTRFKGAAHHAGGQLLLGFKHPEMDGPTLPADVWNMQLAEAESRGPGLPAALRIFLASIVHVPLSARGSSDPFTPPVMLMGPDERPWTLRRFLGLIYARTGRLPRPKEYWPVLWGAREVLHAVEMPYQWNGRLWSRPLLRLDWPQSLAGGYETSMLDEPWPVSVHLPPGDGNGAPVNWHRLRQYMTRDAAAARALINLAYRWHIEGKRLMPAPGKAKHWLQLRDPKVHDRITDRLAEQLCFPPGTGRARRRDRIADARAALERLVKAGDAVAVDGRLLPPVPCEERDGNRAERDGNRAERDGNRAPPPDSTA